MSLRLSLLIGAAVFAAALAALAPLRLGLELADADAAGLSAREVHGRLWDGRLTGARAGPLVLGDLRAGLDPLALVGGTVRLRTTGEGPVRRAVFVSGPGGRGVEALEADLPLSTLTPEAGLPGSLALRGATVRFGPDGACREARGRVSTEALRPWGGPALAGDLQCRGRVAEARLGGEAGTVRTAAVLALCADGAWSLTTRVEGAGPDLAAALALAGFDADGEALSRRRDGKLGLGV